MAGPGTRPLPPLRIPYFLVVGRQPQPQLLLAVGRGAWLFLLIRLPILPHLLLVRIFSSGAA
ncbi:MAG: hypothetical protein A3H39_18330 [candidate division NC10 bacterium RIFCSPLOWO2_02_FULL_66_22]|nr:MAG: hypothetical protein A3H39_18330 [candidate division NC10 bacterium RIFCSPLOWO2_02_FULL_66_22]